MKKKKNLGRLPNLELQHSRTVMSESEGRLSSVSSVSSISLMEIKTETHLVLQAFLERTLSTPYKDRPGTVGGAYDDQNKYSSSSKPQSNSKDGYSSPAEDDRKNAFKDFIKQLPHRNPNLRPKDPKGSLTRISKSKQSQTEVGLSPSSSSDEEDSEKKRKQKQMKIKKRISLFFKKKVKEKKERDKEQRQEDGAGCHPQSPSDLPIDKERDVTQVIISPNHPPQFYNEVAVKLEKIAKNSTKIKTPSPILKPPAVFDKEALVQQLVQLVCSEGDSMNEKIQADPFLRSRLNRLSYASFAKVLDIFGSTEVTQAPPLPPSSSPTLRRMAVSMEVSRRIVTATGAQRTKGYAERYMESFAPWVKSHGGWENVVDIEELVEFD
ncbi:bcl-2-like protein 12 isoform X2 [Kryptolebias marmoratus]|uniref:bcl-2-like protein 12 isoform X2 n=1 Tax=Kryptolebias marmoratus TaxID=37003 RepID=UPI0018ACD406|nr:bcl-2-like protein 12 isoform X2 [Kryptolebias marmoratus]